jgi:hypothetical protein
LENQQLLIIQRELLVEPNTILPSPKNLGPRQELPIREFTKFLRRRRQIKMKPCLLYSAALALTCCAYIFPLDLPNGVNVITFDDKNNALVTPQIMNDDSPVDSSVQVPPRNGGAVIDRRDALPGSVLVACYRPLP